MATPPRTPHAPPTREHSPTIDSPPPQIPQEEPFHPTPSGAVTITAAPPLPPEAPKGENHQKPVMEAGEAEQSAGQAAMELFAERTKAEEDAGKAAVTRYQQQRPQPAPNAPVTNVHGVPEAR
jgi:hypothetical protein